MKKTIVILSTAVLMGFAATAQESEESVSENSKKHEIKIDAVELIAVANIEVTYEYLISKYSGAGVSFTFDLEDKDEDVEDIVNWSITPFYRQYFFNRQEKLAQGLFAEGHLNLGGYNDVYYSYMYDPITETSRESTEASTATALGAGFGVGYKWASDNGFVIEALVGVGRNLAFLSESISQEDNYYNDFEFYFRGGIQVGYRF